MKTEKILKTDLNRLKNSKQHLVNKNIPIACWIKCLEYVLDDNITGIKYFYGDTPNPTKVR